jgi:hypothetical protein
MCPWSWQFENLKETKTLLIFYDSCLNLLKTKGQPFIVYMHHAWTHQENNNNKSRNQINLGWIFNIYILKIIKQHCLNKIIYSKLTSQFLIFQMRHYTNLTTIFKKLNLE